MSEGFKQIVTNTQERAISSDLNRLQKVGHRDVAELLRYWLDATGSDDLDSGVIAEPASIETPLRAEIINGILCRPQAASQNVFVDPGVVMLMAPDAGPDESNYKYINDAGTTTPGALVIAAGAAATRIDVVECRMNAVDLVATESRDIFDPVTGLFSASVVTKERQGRLEYRVRQGVAGAGYPAAVSGWLPLMVASVPLTALTNDDCTFWDVRPLVSDRAFDGYNLTRDIPQVTAAQITIDTTGILYGSVDVVSGKGRRLGGRMRRGSPGADADSIDISNAANQSGAAFAGDTLRYLYLATPFGLPRWARYASAPSVRVPRNPRGIPILSDVPPQHQRNVPSAVVALPASTGLGSSTSDAVCIAAPSINAGVVLRGSVVDGDSHYVDTAGLLTASNLVLAATTVAAGLVTWTLVPNTNYPANARELYVMINIHIDLADGTQELVSEPTIAIGTAVPGNIPARAHLTEQRFVNNFGIPLSFSWSWTGWVPIPSNEFPAAVGGNRQLRFTKNGGSVPSNNAIAIMGWRF